MHCHYQLLCVPLTISLLIAVLTIGSLFCTIMYKLLDCTAIDIRDFTGMHSACIAIQYVPGEKIRM